MFSQLRENQPAFLKVNADGKWYPAMCAKLRMSEQEWKRLRGPISIKTEAQAVKTPYGTVPRIIMRIYDDPQHPLQLESFLNTENPDHSKDFDLYKKSEYILIFLLDLDSEIRITKKIHNLPLMQEVLETAVELNRKDRDFNFERAKEWILQNMEL